MDQVRQDLRHAARRLLRRPGFAAIAILTLGLGIGANVAIYTVVRAVLLEPLPYAEADRLALVSTCARASSRVAGSRSPRRSRSGRASPASRMSRTGPAARPTWRAVRETRSGSSRPV